MKSNTKAIGKRKSREPRTKMHLTMKNMFSKVIDPLSVLDNSRFHLSYVLRLCTTIIKSWFDRETSEFYLHEVFQKVEISWKLRLRRKREWKRRKNEKEGSCSTSYSSGNQVDGLPLVAIGKRKSRRPRTQVLLTMEIMFSNVIGSWSVFDNDIIVVDQILKFL